MKGYYEARKKDVDLIVFPECCLTGYPPRDIPRADLVNFDLVKETCSKIQILSNELRISVLVGTVCKDNGQIYNRAVLFYTLENYIRRKLTLIL